MAKKVAEEQYESLRIYMDVCRAARNYYTLDKKIELDGTVFKLANTELSSLWKLRDGEKHSLSTLALINFTTCHNCWRDYPNFMLKDKGLWEKLAKKYDVEYRGGIHDERKKLKSFKNVEPLAYIEATFNKRYDMIWSANYQIANNGYRALEKLDKRAERVLPAMKDKITKSRDNARVKAFKLDSVLKRLEEVMRW